MYEGTYAGIRIGDYAVYSAYSFSTKNDQVSVILCLYKMLYFSKNKKGKSHNKTLFINFLKQWTV